MRGSLRLRFKGLSTVAAIVVSVATALPSSAGTVVTFDTVFGPFDVLLYDETTTETVENFLGYVCSGQYDDTIFHRLDPDFVLQGGGFTYDNGAVELPSGSPIALDTQISNTRGTIAMARTAALDSADRQFYFNLVDNAALDGPEGYAVFGEVLGNGMDVIDQLASQQPWNASVYHHAWNELPLIDYQMGEPIDDYLEWLHGVNVSGDVNDDGYVDTLDLDGIVLSNWGTNVTSGDAASGDASGDGFVGQDDLDKVLGNWHGGLAQAMSSEVRSIPEPSVLGILATALGVLIRKR